MIPVRLILSLASAVVSEHVPSTQDGSSFPGSTGRKLHVFSKREITKENNPGQFIAFACLIPILVILSGIFAGLTLGYMSLDETQLQVLSMSGTPKQREYANKIKPIRKNGHLLLVTLLLANMITNETLPVISDPILGGGFQSVVVSTVLIVLFAEIIPQSICTRYGLVVGAKMAGVVRILIYTFGIVAWPVAKLLEFTLGPHHGIIYRRAELKELIAMHGAQNPLGGDLRTDTVTIIGATLDLQDKTVQQAMTPINKVFMLHIDSKLDYDTLRRVCATGHSRIPVYEEVEVELPPAAAIGAIESGMAVSTPGLDAHALAEAEGQANGSMKLIKTRVKKILGILLVKQCVLLDPEDAVPLRNMRLNKVPFVSQHDPVLGVLDRFQEGHSHVAIVSRISRARAQSVKKAVKKSLTHRLMGALHGDSSSDSSSSDEDSSDEEGNTTAGSSEKKEKEDDGIEKGSNDEGIRKSWRKRRQEKKQARREKKKQKQADLEKGNIDAEAEREKDGILLQHRTREQLMPADAVLSRQDAEAYLESQAIDPAIMPLGIITLEDVLEEVIGEEIYDEFDVEGGGAHSQTFVPPGAHFAQPGVAAGTLRKLTTRIIKRKNSAPELLGGDVVAKSDFPEEAKVTTSSQIIAPVPSKTFGMGLSRPAALKSLGFLGGRSKSTPPSRRQPVRSRSTPPAPVDSATTAASTTPSATLQPSSAVMGAKPSPDVGVDGIQLSGKPSTVVETPDSGRALSQITENAAPVEGSAKDNNKLEVSSQNGAAAAGPVATRPARLKGAFKSSPLLPVGPDANAVIADEIRRQKQLSKEKEAGSSSVAGYLQQKDVE